MSIPFRVVQASYSHMVEAYQIYSETTPMFRWIQTVDGDETGLAAGASTKQSERTFRILRLVRRSLRTDGTDSNQIRATADTASLTVRCISTDTFSSIAFMSISSPSSAPWQLSQGSAASRITAAALIAVALDSTFAWRVVPVVLSIALLIVPLLVAIRVVRGFPAALLAAAATLGAVAVLVGFSIANPAVGQPTTIASPLIVAGIVSLVGLASAIIAWLGERRRSRPVIAIEFTESGGFAVVRSRPRRTHNRSYR
jgi:hypothetical protein